MTIYSIVVNTTGSTGSATGTGGTPTGQRIYGVLHAVKYTYGTGAVTTQGFTLAEADGLGRTLLTITGNTSGTVYPTVVGNTSTGAAQSGGLVPYVVDCTQLVATVTTSNALSPNVTLAIEVVE